MMGIRGGNDVPLQQVLLNDFALLELVQMFRAVRTCPLSGLPFCVVSLVFLHPCCFGIGKNRNLEIRVVVFFAAS